MFKPLRDWTLNAVVLAGWAAALVIAALCFVLPLTPMLILIAVYVLYGMVRMFRTGAPVLVDVGLFQLLGLCVAWPLALRSAALRR
ncbi:MAG: hypothetical protein P4L83_19015 [Nevskia sp.]|nr:hypothetical protein [Nevskia sp.]